MHNRRMTTDTIEQREPAGHYWEQLQLAGLTMAPLEQA
jgi:hypothetical protein